MSNIRYLSPFIHTEKTAPYIYLTHIAALMPCIAAGFVFYGISAITLIVGCAVAFMLLDNAFGRMVRRDGISRNYTDFSSIEAGVIYALLLPPGTSLVVALTGVLFGSFVVKQFFGGAGNNILVKSNEDYAERRRYQEKAALTCNTLLADIEIAASLFHLRGKRVKFWTGQVVEIRNRTRAWIKYDADRYKQYR